MFICKYPTLNHVVSQKLNNNVKIINEMINSETKFINKLHSYKRNVLLSL